MILNNLNDPQVVLSSKESVFIKVSARVRPIPISEEDEVIDYELEPIPTVYVVPKSPISGGKASLRVLTSPYMQTGTYRNYSFENVFAGDASQCTVFEECGRELCDKFLQGKNCNIIVYGPTSTGKTYTMQGDIHGAAKHNQIKAVFE